MNKMLIGGTGVFLGITLTFIGVYFYYRNNSSVVVSAPVVSEKVKDGALIAPILKTDPTLTPSVPVKSIPKENQLTCFIDSIGSEQVSIYSISATKGELIVGFKLGTPIDEIKRISNLSGGTVSSLGRAIVLVKYCGEWNDKRVKELENFLLQYAAVENVSPNFISSPQ